MKKTVTILMLLAVMLSSSCKKSNKQPNTQAPQQSVPAQTDSALYSVTISSNYLRSYLGVDNITDNKVIKRFNNGSNDMNCPITYTFYAKATKKYFVSSNSTKNSADSTLFMTDQGHVWNKMVITKNGVTVYNNKDSIGGGSWPITVNNFQINY